MAAIVAAMMLLFRTVETSVATLGSIHGVHSTIMVSVAVVVLIAVVVVVVVNFFHTAVVEIHTAIHAVVHGW